MMAWLVDYLTGTQVVGDATIWIDAGPRVEPGLFVPIFASGVMATVSS